MSQKNDLTRDCDDGFRITPPPRALTKIGHIRAELARVYRMARTGELKTQDATRLTFVLISLAKLIEGSDLEERIKILESAAKEKENDRI